MEGGSFRSYLRVRALKTAYEVVDTDLSMLSLMNSLALCDVYNAYCITEVPYLDSRPFNEAL